MGYYTFFNITAQNYKRSQLDETVSALSDEQVAAINKEFEKLELNHDFDCGSLSTYAKWYDWEEDMSAISLKFPGVLFTIDGDGEESDDLWRAYVLNGAVQYSKAKIVYDDFDTSLLTSATVTPPERS